METHLTRQTLLLKAKNQGNHTAWEELASFYQGYIYVIIRSMGVSHTEIDDILQHVLLSLWKALPDYEYTPGKSKFRYWVAQITRNKVIDHFRKVSKHRKKIEKIEKYQQDEQDTGFEKLVTQEWQLFLSNTALKNIEKDFKPIAIECFLLYSKGIDTKEIAEKTGLKLDTCYKNISRIKVKLIKEIKRIQVELDI